MLRLAAALAFAIAGCNSPQRAPSSDAPTSDAKPALVDAPPPAPSVDAGPPPAESCMADAGTCALPPSTCLDPHYLVYYTGGSCVAGSCSFMTNELYCPIGCINGGCEGGFT